MAGLIGSLARRPASSPPAPTSFGWDGDLEEPPAVDWHSFTGATVEQLDAMLYVDAGALAIDTDLAVAAGAAADFEGYGWIGPKCPLPFTLHQKFERVNTGSDDRFMQSCFLQNQDEQNVSPPGHAGDNLELDSPGDAAIDVSFHHFDGGTWTGGGNTHYVWQAFVGRYGMSGKEAASLAIASSNWSPLGTVRKDDNRDYTSRLDSHHMRHRIGVRRYASDSNRRLFVRIHTFEMTFNSG